MIILLFTSHQTRAYFPSVLSHVKTTFLYYCYNNIDAHLHGSDLVVFVCPQVCLLGLIAVAVVRAYPDGGHGGDGDGGHGHGHHYDYFVSTL